MAWQIDFTLRRAMPSFELLDPPKPEPFYFGISTNRYIDASRMPTKVRLKSAWSKPIPDLFPLPGLNGVNQRFRDLVETFEPGLHQFFPLKLFGRDGSPLDGTYYIFNCAVGIDAIIHTTAEPKWATNMAGMPILFTGQEKKFELSRQAIGDRHLWCGKTVAIWELFASDVFYEAIKRNKIVGFDAVYRKELDVPWIAEKELAPILRWQAGKH